MDSLFTTKAAPKSAETFFDVFWREWPTVKGKRHYRAGNKATCLKRWNALDCDDVGQRVLDCLAAWKRCEQWTREEGNYIPAPEVWLNKRPWDAGDPPPAPGLAGDGGRAGRIARIARMALNLGKQEDGR